MNKLWLFLIILLLFSGCIAPKIKRNLSWKEFVSDEGGFKATFPETPKLTIAEFAETGKVQNIRYGAALPQIYTGVWYADYPNIPPMNQDELKTYYDYQRDRVLQYAEEQKAPTRMIRERDVWLDGKLGREVIVSQKDNTVTYRLYIFEKRIFQVLASVKSSDSDNEEVQQNASKFLDSFQPLRK